MWIYWVQQYVVERLSPEHIHALKPELHQLATMAENDIVATRIGAAAGIWEQETLNRMLDNKIRAYEEFLLELKALKTKTSPDQPVQGRGDQQSRNRPFGWKCMNIGPDPTISFSSSPTG
ncbi:UNKNOWN [Stylonychia lemnae]|uniref:Uncharacterized protein n=1 Tax=Stylonychia lemnae TaxID=5949 RepID=A0A078B6J9_STYLE|nr:UNKNOWN [Stylonychia lemnae]|eukprot:CDW89188.1 UNKNOWN [Stylonychia lemnae]